jgi:hypothetical protein
MEEGHLRQLFFSEWKESIATGIILIFEMEGQ